MGEPMAANYVNLLVEDFEHNLLQDYYKKTIITVLWFRFIGNIFYIWTGKKESPNDFKITVNLRT